MKKCIAVMCIAIVALSFAFAQGGAEETYPNGNINIIVSSKAGGDTDAYARAIAEYLDDELGVPVNIINKNSDKIKALVSVLRSDEIKKFLEDSYDGAVIFFEK